MSDGTEKIAENPEYFVAIIVALVRRMGGIDKVVFNLAEMQEAMAYGIGLHTGSDKKYMTLTLLENPDAPDESAGPLDYTTSRRPLKYN